MRSSEILIQLNRTPKFAICACPIPRHECSQPHSDVCISRIVIQSNGSFRECQCIGDSLIGRGVIVKTQHAIRFSHTSVCRRVTWVLFYCLSKKVNCSLPSFSGPFVLEVPSLNVCLISFGV